MKMLRFAIVVFRFHSRPQFEHQECESIALAAYGEDGDRSRAVLVKNHYQKIVNALGLPPDVVFVNTFLAGFAPLFAACPNPESVCSGIHKDLLRAKDLLELSERRIVFAPSLESALARVGQNYVKFGEVCAVTGNASTQPNASRGDEVWPNYMLH